MTNDFLKLTFLAIGTLLASATLSSAQQNCAPREVVIERLASVYGETRRSIGLGSNNTIVEVFAADNGTWTITFTNPAGTTCLVASGQAFEAVAEALTIPNDDA